MMISAMLEQYGEATDAILLQLETLNRKKSYRWHMALVIGCGMCRCLTSSEKRGIIMDCVVQIIYGGSCITDVLLWKRILKTSDSDSKEEAGERETVFRRRILIDLTLGEEAVVTVIDEPVTPLIPPEEPVFVPYTLDSPEMLEDYTVIRNSCA